jgi:hypothetical protein
MGEDVNSVSPTLGFIIKTIDYEGLVSGSILGCSALTMFCKLQAQYLLVYTSSICALTDASKGMLVARRLSDHTGEITLRRQML